MKSCHSASWQWLATQHSHQRKCRARCEFLWQIVTCDRVQPSESFRHIWQANAMVGELSIIWDKGWEVLNELLIWFQECWPRKEQSLHVVPMCCHHLTHTPFARKNCRTAKDEESFRVLARCRLEINDLSTATARRYLCTRKRLYTDIYIYLYIYNNIYIYIYTEKPFTREKITHINFHTLAKSWPSVCPCQTLSLHYTIYCIWALWNVAKLL